MRCRLGPDGCAASKRRECLVQALCRCSLAKWRLESGAGVRITELRCIWTKRLGCAQKLTESVIKGDTLPQEGNAIVGASYGPAGGCQKRLASLLASPL